MNFLLLIKFSLIKLSHTRFDRAQLALQDILHLSVFWRNVRVINRLPQDFFISFVARSMLHRLKIWIYSYLIEYYVFLYFEFFYIQVNVSDQDNYNKTRLIRMNYHFVLWNSSRCDKQRTIPPISFSLTVSKTIKYAPLFLCNQNFNAVESIQFDAFIHYTFYRLLISCDWFIQISTMTKWNITGQVIDTMCISLEFHFVKTFKFRRSVQHSHCIWNE